MDFDSYKNEEEFQAALFKYHEVTNHPKVDDAYFLAYQYGHSGGYKEVAGYFADFVTLIK